MKIYHYYVRMISGELFGLDMTEEQSDAFNSMLMVYNNLMTVNYLTSVEFEPTSIILNKNLIESVRLASVRDFDVKDI